MTTSRFLASFLAGWTFLVCLMSGVAAPFNVPPFPEEIAIATVRGLLIVVIGSMLISVRMLGRITKGKKVGTIAAVACSFFVYLIMHNQLPLGCDFLAALCCFFRLNELNVG